MGDKMRLQGSITNDREWYREAGNVSWGFGVDVIHFADEKDTGDDTELVGAGFQVNLMLGPWMLSLFDEAGFRQVFGSDAQYFGRFSVLG